MSFSEARFPSKSKHCAWHMHSSRNSVTIPAREAGEEPFKYFRNCPQDRFQSPLKFRAQATKPVTSTVPHHVHGTYSCIAIMKMKKQFRFQGEILSFRESLRQGHPRICCQSSTSTNVTNTHEGFSAACKSVLCCLMNTAHTNPTPPTQPQCHKCNAFQEGFVAAKQYKS